MIVRILSSGSSFKGLAAYLTHDPDRAETQERVAWTHTLNLASDDVDAAVKEMQLTAANAELLKQEAGIRAGGRSTDEVLKHVSLNWPRSEEPSREHMIESAQAFLEHMKWQDHQAILVAHSDKHPHVHLAINVVHPDTGLHLDDSFEKRRAQAWALGYERENGKIHCEERLKVQRERQDSLPRDAWMAFQENQREFDRAEKSRRDYFEKVEAREKNPNISNFDEWKILKDFQMREREEFFAEGKAEFSKLRSAIYLETREVFRPAWRELYQDLEAGYDPEKMADRKKQLIEHQRIMLEANRDVACTELRATRDEIYRGLLDEQRQTRAELRGRQEEGWDNTGFFAALAEREASVELVATFREAAKETTVREDLHKAPIGNHVFLEATNDNEPEHSPGVNMADEIGIRAGFAALSLFEMAFRVFDGNSTATPRPNSNATNLFAAAATSEREQKERDTAADEEWRRRQQTIGG